LEKTVWRNALLTVLEALLTLGIGVYLYLNPDTKTLGEITIVVSTILVINRAISSLDTLLALGAQAKEITSQYGQLANPITKIGEIIDVSTRADVGSIKVLIDEYLALSEDKLSAVRQGVIDAAIASLRELRSTMRTPILEEPDFYSWLYREFDHAAPGTHIQIVSVDEELEWMDTPQELEYFNRNVAAAKRGVIVERIFLFSDTRLKEAASNSFIYAHRKGSGTKLLGRYVNRDTFSKIAQSAVRDAGQGFIVFDDRFAIVDVFSSDGKARGYVTFLKSDIKKFGETFERFKNLSSLLVFE